MTHNSRSNDPFSDIFNLAATVGQEIFGDLFPKMPGQTHEKNAQMEKLLTAARATWSATSTQASLSADEKQYLRGQVTLIVTYLVSEDLITYTPLCPDRKSLETLVSTRIVPVS